MIEPRILQRALIVGSVLQVAWIALGHFYPPLRAYGNVFLFGGMMISAIAGYLYGMDFGAGYARGALGGAVAGGGAALIGIAFAVLLADASASELPLGVAISVLTGAVGGLWGEVAARMRRAGW